MTLQREYGTTNPATFQRQPTLSSGLERGRDSTRHEAEAASRGSRQRQQAEAAQDMRQRQHQKAVPTGQDGYRAHAADRKGTGYTAHAADRNATRTTPKENNSIREQLDRRATRNESHERMRAMRDPTRRRRRTCLCV